MFSGLLSELEHNLKKLPGIGAKSARRLAMYIIAMDKDSARNLSDSIAKAIESFSYCSRCNMLTESDPCSFCSDPARDEAQLCVVQSTQDVYLIEETHQYRGKYFVLNNLLSPLDGIGPDEIDFPKLLKVITAGEVEELILALNPSAEGEATINFLANQLENEVNNITRLSTGIPLGGDIEYTNPLTLGTALKRRYQIEKNNH